MQNRWFVIAVLLAWSAPAHAGRSFFGWLYSTEVMSERRVELQTWVFEEDGKVGNTKQTSLWSAPLVGITDQLELALPIEMSSTGADMEAQTFALQRVGIEARYRLVPAEVNEEPVFVPLIRVAAKRDVIVRNDVRLEADLVGSYESGAVQVLADAGFTADLTPSNQHVEVHPGAGISVRVAEQLRLGAEAYAEFSFDGESWAVVGPDLSWTHHRFWVTGTFGIGVYQAQVAPRVMWGLAF